MKKHRKTIPSGPTTASTHRRLDDAGSQVLQLALDLRNTAIESTCNFVLTSVREGSKHLTEVTIDDILDRNVLGAVADHITTTNGDLLKRIKKTRENPILFLLTTFRAVGSR